MDDKIGRLLGIGFGLCLVCGYNDIYVQIIGLLEIIVCILLYIFYIDVSFDSTKWSVVLIFVPVLLWRRAYIPAIILLLWDSIGIIRF